MSGKSEALQMMMMPNSLLAHWQEPALVKDHLLLSDWHQLPQN